MNVLIFSCPNVSFCLFNSSWLGDCSSQVGKSVCYLESLPGTAAWSPAVGDAVPGAHLRDFGVRTELSSGKKNFMQFICSISDITEVNEYTKR